MLPLYISDDSKKEDNVVMMSSPLMHILGFLETLTNTNTDGRIVTKKEGNSNLILKLFHCNN